MHPMHELAAQGMPLHAIAQQLGLARNTVRKYVRGGTSCTAHQTHAVGSVQGFRFGAGCTRIIYSPSTTLKTDLQSTMFRAWLPPAVYERLRDGLGEFLTELRPAVALFLRFDGLDYRDPA